MNFGVAVGVGVGVGHDPAPALLEIVEQRLQLLHRGAVHVSGSVNDVGDLGLEVGASIGVARWLQDGASASTLLRRADMAMYTAKANRC